MAAATAIVPVLGFDSVTENDSSGSTAVSPTNWMVIVWVVSDPTKVAVPAIGPEKSAASAAPAPPSPVTAQSTVAEPDGLLRVTVKVKAVVPAEPSGRTASVAAMEKVSTAAPVSVWP